MALKKVAQNLLFSVEEYVGAEGLFVWALPVKLSYHLLQKGVMYINVTLRFHKTGDFR